MDNEEANRKMAESRLNMGKEPGGSYADLNQKDSNQQQEKQNQSYNNGKPSCFTGDTKVLTSNGWKEIRSIHRGQTVLSCTKSGDLIDRDVIRQKVHSVPSKIWQIEFDGETTDIRVTAGHSFLTERGWVKASCLQEGELIPFVNAEGQIETHAVQRLHSTEQYEETFNLVTAGESNFIVLGAIAHNFTYFRVLRSLLANTIYHFNYPSPKRVFA